MDELMMETLLTEDEYRQALKRFLEICDTDDNTPEADELDQLMIVMEIYEQENCSWNQVVSVQSQFPETKYKTFSNSILQFLKTPENLSHSSIVLQ